MAGTRSQNAKTRYSVTSLLRHCSLCNRDFLAPGTVAESGLLAYGNCSGLWHLRKPQTGRESAADDK